MKEILTAQNRFRNNLFLVLKSAPTLNNYALCSSLSLTEIWHFGYNVFTFSCDILKEYFCCEISKKNFVFTGQPCSTSLAPFHKQSDLFLGDHLSPSKHFLCMVNKLSIIKLQESPRKLILKAVTTEKCQFTKKTPETAEGC